MGFAPKEASKTTHGTIRELFKVWLLSAQYGAVTSTLVRRLSVEFAAGMADPGYSAEDFLWQHRQVYRRYWQWARRHVDSFLISGCAETCYRWRHHLNSDLPNWKIQNEALNFPIQAAGAEMLRWACVCATEAGIKVCAPVHDALVVCGPSDRAEEIVSQTKACMDKASEDVLGLRVRTDVKVVNHPERFEDPRGVETWARIMGMLAEIEASSVEKSSVKSSSRV
jgi:DNA polymerase I-like protein with 3'-5' exonuclease and polymerase domains